MTQQEMERRLLALERRVSGSQGGISLAYGQSTLFGAASQNYRDHFPVKLTSSYSSTTGYSWERRGLDRAAASPTVVDLSTPQSGKYAFTPDNDTTLTSGTYGYLVAEPCAGGWLFLKSAAGASSYSNQTISLDADFSITSGTTFQTVTRSSGNMAITAASTGTYRLSWQVTGTVTYNAGAVGTPYIVCRIYDGFGGLADSECTVCYSPLNSLTAQGTVSGFVMVSLARTYTLQAVVNLPISGTLNVANIKFDNNTGGTLAYPGSTHMLLEKFA